MYNMNRYNIDIFFKKILKILKIVIIIAVIYIITAMFVFNANLSSTIMVFKNNKSTYEILVDVEESKLYLFEDNILIKTYTCSGGKWNTPSPIGTWKITKKAKWGEGFGRKLFRYKCTMGKFWNTWNP